MPTYLVTGYDTNGKRKSEPVEADSREEAMRDAGFVAEDATERPDLGGYKKTRSSTCKPTPNQLPGLQTASIILRVIGFLAGAIGLLGGVVLLVVMAGDEQPAAAAIIASIAPTLTLFVCGVFLFALAEAFLALRIIAINSYKD